ncbi:MAG: hypothetical protein JW841_04125 [Deltaproteobacteria bacterium]|nr:hypothetical protein [Deltaproteobacteria bacterium]
MGPLRVLNDKSPSAANRATNQQPWDLSRLTDEELNELDEHGDKSQTASLNSVSIKKSGDVWYELGYYSNIFV